MLHRGRTAKAAAATLYAVAIFVTAAAAAGRPAPGGALAFSPRQSPDFLRSRYLWHAGGFEEFRDIDVAAQTLLLEAAGEGYSGMLAVAEVIRNRAAALGLSPSEVCLAPYQFSAWNDVSRAHEFLRAHEPYRALALRAWLESARSSLTRGATHYHAEYVAPGWASAYRRVAKIGRHIFYRASD